MNLALGIVNFYESDFKAALEDLKAFLLHLDSENSYIWKRRDLKTLVFSVVQLASMDGNRFNSSCFFSTLNLSRCLFVHHPWQRGCTSFKNELYKAKEKSCNELTKKCRVLNHLLWMLSSVPGWETNLYFYHKLIKILMNTFIVCLSFDLIMPLR